MATLKGKYKTAQELIKKTKETLEKADSSKKATVEEANKMVAHLRDIIFGSEAEGEPSADVVAQVAQEIYTANLLATMVSSMAKVDFETQKDIVAVFGRILRREIGMRFPTVEYICSRDDILVELVKGYENPNIALQVGVLLRDCIKQEPLAKMILLRDDLFYKLFDYVQFPAFDVAADAFSTFKDLLTKHKIIAANYLEANYDKVFTRYLELLGSDNYVTRRQSLKLLGELLLDRANFTVMSKFIGNPENLKLMMNLLRDKSKNIQFEAFHVFKVFVANPTKTQPILDILLKNRDKMVAYLLSFHQDRDDEQFADEKQYLIKQIRDLQ